jgi:hypothetical protein
MLPYSVEEVDGNDEFVDFSDSDKLETSDPIITSLLTGVSADDAGKAAEDLLSSFSRMQQTVSTHDQLAVTPYSSAAVNVLLKVAAQLQPEFAHRPLSFRTYSDKEKHVHAVLCNILGPRMASRLTNTPYSTVYSHLRHALQQEEPSSPDLQRVFSENHSGAPPLLSGEDEELLLSVVTLLRSVGFTVRGSFLCKIALAAFRSKYPEFKASKRWLYGFCARNNVPIRVVHSHSVPSEGILALQELIQRFYFDAATIHHLIGPFHTYLSCDEFRLSINQLAKFTLQPRLSGPDAFSINFGMQRVSCSVVPVFCISGNGEQFGIVTCQIIFASKKEIHVPINFEQKFPLLVSHTSSSFSTHVSFSSLLDKIGNEKQPDGRVVFSCDVVSNHIHEDCIQRLFRHRFVFLPCARHTTPYTQVVDRLVQLIRHEVMKYVEDFMAAGAAASVLSSTAVDPTYSDLRQLHDMISSRSKNRAGEDDIIRDITIVTTSGKHVSVMQLRALMVKWVHDSIVRVVSVHAKAGIHAFHSTGILFDPRIPATAKNVNAQLPSPSGSIFVSPAQDLLYATDAMFSYDGQGDKALPQLTPCWLKMHRSLPSPYPSHRGVPHTMPTAELAWLSLLQIDAARAATAVLPLLYNQADMDMARALIDEHDQASQLQHMETGPTSMSLLHHQHSSDSSSLSSAVATIVNDDIFVALAGNDTSQSSIVDDQGDEELKARWKERLPNLSAQQLVSYAQQLGVDVGKRKKLESLANHLLGLGYDPPSS